jgi:hypothetical protein
LPWHERLRCGVSIVRWARMKWRALASDVAFAALMAGHSGNWRRRCYAIDRWTEAAQPAVTAPGIAGPGQTESFATAP